MRTALEKEKVLYDIVDKKENDKDFIIAFSDYFEYLISDGTVLLVSMLPLIKVRTKSHDDLVVLQNSLFGNINKTFSNLEKTIKKNKLQDDEALKDSIMSMNGFFNKTNHVIGGSLIEAMYDDIYDILNRMIYLGFQKNISKYIKWSAHKEPRIEDIIGFEKRHIYLFEYNTFIKKDARSIEGALMRLINLLTSIKTAEAMDMTKFKVTTHNLFAQLDNRSKNIEYHSLMSGTLTADTKYFKKENYTSDLERIHNYIILNNSETSKEETISGESFFYIKKNIIFDYKNNKLSFKLRGVSEPKYIKIFKDIISYFPQDKNKIRVSEFELLLPKNSKNKNTYRSNIGSNAKSFNSFLKKNGIQNIHPETKEKIVDATDEYITFNNKI